MRKKTGFAHLLLALLLAASLSGCGETAAPERTAGTVTRETDAPVETPADAPAPEATAAPAEKPDLADTPAPAETLVPEISDATTPSPAPTVTPVPEATAAPDEDPGSYAEDVPVYTPVLDVLCDYLSRGKPWWENTAAGLTGISEMVSYLGEDAAQDLGYVITDLSGDGVPELAVCITSGDGSSGVVGNEVLCLYTWADGEPLLVLEGWARNSYHWLGGGRFFYRGSSGAVYSILGTYALSRDGRESKCEECWFTWPRDDDWSVIDYWYNQLGEMDPEVSEPWEGRDIWEIEEELASQVRDIELAPLSGYLASWRSRQAENAPLLSAYWPDQVPNAYPDYLLCSLAEGESGWRRGRFCGRGDPVGLASAGADHGRVACGRAGAFHGAGPLHAG